jgi:hypothetical protein
VTGFKARYSAHWLRLFCSIAFVAGGAAASGGEPSLSLRIQVSPPNYTLTKRTVLPDDLFGVSLIEGTSIRLRLESDEELRTVRVKLRNTAGETKTHDLRPVVVAAEIEQRMIWELPPKDTWLEAVDSSISFEFEIVDGFGGQPRRPLTGNIHVHSDRPPTVSLGSLHHNALPLATPTVECRVEDNFGLSNVALTYDVVRHADGPPERHRAVLYELREGEQSQDSSPPEKSGSFEHVIRFGELKLDVGDKVRIQLHATDWRGDGKGQTQSSDPMTINIADVETALADVITALEAREKPTDVSKPTNWSGGQEKRARILLIESEPKEPKRATKRVGETFFFERLANLKSPGPFRDHWAVETLVTHVEGLKPEQIEKADLIVIAGVSHPGDAATVDRLIEHVRKGGALIIAAGDEFKPRTWNKLAWRKGQGILPVALKSKLITQSPEKHDVWDDTELTHLTAEGLLNRDYFPYGGANADGSRRLLFQGVLFRKFVKTTPLTDDKATVVAQFNNGLPYMVERQIGAGKVLLITTSLGTSWNTLPTSPFGFIVYHSLFRGMMRDVLPQADPRIQYELAESRAGN